MQSSLRACLLTLFAAVASANAAPPDAWQGAGEVKPNRPARDAWVQPAKSRAFSVDHPRLRAHLNRAGKESSRELRTPDTEISLPMPDGTQARFAIIESPVMEPELAAKFPEIKTFRGVGIDDPQATVRLDITPSGMHAQILSPRGAVYIDPYWRGDNALHTSYYKRDYRRQTEWMCLARGSDALSSPTAGSSDVSIQTSGGTLRTYRLACAATGEYTAFQGGTVAAGQAAIVTAVNRVTGVYEIEFTIRLVLVANNDQIVYTNPSTDPYSNSNGSLMLSQNQTTCDNVIGSANYDIGHVFSTGGGGVAFLGVVCNSGSKAGGVTGLPSPTGDAFWIDYVAHEMGHQFGANHTFNSATGNCGGGNRNASTAYEPGSGSTIMAYAGICGADNLKSHSDPYFHWISQQEIINYVGTQSCQFNTSTGNNAPNIPSNGGNFSIPASTPFMLTATGSDPDGDPLTYCWEEADLGAATTLAAADNGASPLFRSFNPTNSPTRIFPRIQDVLGNTNSLGEKLPTTSRTMKFRVTVRDNRLNGGGVERSATNGITIISAAGPFLVTFPTTATNLAGNITVAWNVAGATASPINCANVDILLSTNGGFDFPVTLASAVPNTGSATVTLPGVSNATARVMVRGTGNIFFNTSKANFTILPSPLVVTDGATLTSENCSPGNGTVDPDETVTMDLALKNVGTAPVSNVVATLLATGGVTSPSGAQSYGTLGTNGASVARSFTFIANGICGATMAATLQLQTNGGNFGTVTFNIPLGQINVPLSEDFASVTPPALPAGWTTSASGGQSNWITIAGTPNAAFTSDNTAIGVNQLQTPSISITSTSAVLSFRHNYSLAASSTNGFSGGVLEIKIGAGSFADILTAGGTFATGGYNATITNAYGNPLAGRAAWSGDSGGFTSTVVKLPASAAAQNVQLRWRAGTGSNTPPFSSSGTLAFWNFDGSTAAPTTVGSNLSATSVTVSNVGGSLTFFNGNPSTGQAVASSGFTTSNGPPTTSYSHFAFAITVANGYQLSLSNLTLDVQRSNTGPANFNVVASQQANFSSVIYNSGVKTATTSFATTTVTLTNAGLTGTVYFRVYAYNAITSGGTLRLDNLNIKGTVTGSGSVGSGWYVDTISISDPVCCSSATNTPPVISAASVNPALPTTTNELLAVVTSASDADGDPITFAYQWQESATNLVGQIASNLLASATFAGGFYRCVITPNDGEGNGAPFTTAEVLVPADADGNGINDDWEVAHFGHIGIDPNANPDGDGMTNLQEFLAGTDPINSGSALRITAITRETSNLRVTWTMGNGKTNALQVTPGDGNGGFSTNNFANLFIVTNTVGSVTNYLDLGGAANDPSRYYRIKLLP